MWDLIISPKRTISASDGFGPLQMVSEPDTERCASGRLFPEGGRHEAVCQHGRWASKEVDLVGVPCQLEKGTSASEYTGP